MPRLQPHNTEDRPGLNVALQRAAISSLLALLIWCVVWEIWFAPLRPGGTVLFLKALPLAFAVRGVARGSLYTIQWASMLVVRVMSDPPGPSITAAWIEIVLASVFFFCSIFYVRPAKRAAALAKKEAQRADAGQPDDRNEGAR
jgi:uncharacterized membrane protein